MEDFWNTINSDKVNINILREEDVFQVTENTITLIVIHVPRANFQNRPIYIGANPFTGAFKRNHEGDYHCTKAEILAMFRDQNAEGVDDMVMEHYTMDDVDADTLRAYRMRFQNENGEHIWNTYDGTWENNVFNFLGKVLPKLTEELPKPFKLKGYI